MAKDYTTFEDDSLRGIADGLLDEHKIGKLKLTDWEESFMTEISEGSGALTQNQRDKLEEIFEQYEI